MSKTVWTCPHCGRTNLIETPRCICDVGRRPRKEAEFFVKLFDRIISGDKPDLERTMLAFSIASKGELGRKALASAVFAWRALKIEPSTAIVMHFGGYDDDPRELWQIPEVCKFVQKFCALTKAHTNPQVEPQSRNWLLACGADPSLPVAVNMITTEQSLEESVKFFKQVIKPDNKT